MQAQIPLTKKQKQTLDFIGSFIRKTGYSPSLKDLARFLKTDNLSTAQYYVGELKNKGYLRKKPNKSRSIFPIGQLQTAPLLGYIAAGKPIEPIENPETISVPQNIKLDSRYSYYALQVKGDSMIDMGILDNDLVLIKHQMAAESGDVVVAVTENGATLKVLKMKNGKIILESHNRDYPTISPQRLDIRGKFVGLIRIKN